MQNESIFLVAGATGESGRHIVRALLKKNKRVRVLIRNMKKFNEVFSKEEVERIEKVAVCDLIEDKYYKSKLAEISKIENHETLEVILSIRYTIEKGNMCGHIANQDLIDAAAESERVKRLILLSFPDRRRELSKLSLSMNHSVQLCRLLTEEYLRKSGLNYLIIKPTEVIIGDEPTSFTICQDDKFEGKINSSTLGYLTVDAILDPWIPANTSFDCTTSKNQLERPYEYIQGMYNLKTDSEKEKRIVQYNAMRKIFSASFWSLLFLFCMGGMYLTRTKYIFWKQAFEKIFKVFFIRIKK